MEKKLIIIILGVIFYVTSGPYDFEFTRFGCTSSTFSLLTATFVIWWPLQCSLDPDQVRRNVGPVLDPNLVLLEDIFEKDYNKSMKLLRMQRVRISVGTGLLCQNVTNPMYNLKSSGHIYRNKYNLSRDMWFPTMWHFDKCRLRRACAASF